METTSFKDVYRAVLVGIDYKTGQAFIPSPPTSILVSLDSSNVELDIPHPGAALSRVPYNGIVRSITSLDY